MKICSLHFKDDYKGKSKSGLGKRYLKDTAVPSMNLPMTSKSPKQSNRSQRLTNRNLMKEMNQEPLASTSAASCDCIQIDQDPNRIEECTANLNNDEIIAVEALCNLFEDNSVKQTFNSIATQVNTNRISTICDLIDSDNKLNSFTGLPNRQLLETLVQLVGKHDNSRIYKLNIMEKIVLTMAKLKTNVSYVVLAILFGITSQTCKNIIIKMINTLATILKPCIKFPTSTEIKTNLPMCFKSFSDTRIILDCTEILIQKPKCLCCRIKCYSQYKSNLTIKFMIGVSPGGLITFVSNCYGGRASDKCIFEQSGLIQLLDRGVNAIMVDKGFLIDKICEEYNIKLFRPPFLRHQRQLSKEESLLNAAIAAARVHVERANQRIKLFSILTTKLQWPLVSTVDDIICIVCAIANLSPPILGDDKFLK